jgi:hypothetical protein
LEEAVIIKAKMRMACEKEELDRADQSALEEIERKMLEIQREKKRVKDQIQLSREKSKMKEDLVETEARIEVCTRFDNDGPFTTIDELQSDNGSKEHLQRFLDSQLTPAKTSPPHAENSTSCDILEHQNTSTTIKLHPENTDTANECQPNTSANSKHAHIYLQCKCTSNHK